MRAFAVRWNIRNANEASSSSASVDLGLQGLVQVQSHLLGGGGGERRQPTIIIILIMMTVIMGLWASYRTE